MYYATEISGKTGVELIYAAAPTLLGIKRKANKEIRSQEGMYAWQGYYDYAPYDMALWHSPEGLTSLGELPESATCVATFNIENRKWKED